MESFLFVWENLIKFPWLRPLCHIECQLKYTLQFTLSLSFSVRLHVVLSTFVKFKIFRYLIPSAPWAHPQTFYWRKKMILKASTKCKQQNRNFIIAPRTLFFFFIKFYLKTQNWNKTREEFAISFNTFYLDAKIKKKDDRERVKEKQIIKIHEKQRNKFENFISILYKFAFTICRGKIVKKEKKFQGKSRFLNWK